MKNDFFLLEMNIEEDSMWMDNLEEFVFEERKLVTYKWLSR